MYGGGCCICQLLSPRLCLTAYISFVHLCVHPVYREGFGLGFFFFLGFSCLDWFPGNRSALPPSGLSMNRPHVRCDISPPDAEHFFRNSFICGCAAPQRLPSSWACVSFYWLINRINWTWGRLLIPALRCSSGQQSFAVSPLSPAAHLQSGICQVY